MRTNGEKTLEIRQGSRFLATAHAGGNGLYEIHIYTEVNVDQVLEHRQGVRSIAIAHARAGDLKISNNATGFIDGDTINTIRNPRFWGRFGETSDVFRDVTMFGNKRPQNCRFYWTLRET